MDDEKKEINLKRKMSIRKKILIATIVLFIIGILIIFSLYIAEESFRVWVDLNLLRKNVTTEDVPTIDLDTNKSNQIYVYSKYIAILNEKKVSLYNNYGDKTSEISVDISNAIFDSSNKYLAIAEDGGKNFYLFLEGTYLWSGNINGEILQIHVNQNGYMAIVTTDSTYKSIITLYNSQGEELFNYRLSTTRVIDATISKDNKYLAFAELDTSGTLIQSNIKVLSIDNALNSKNESIIYSYSADRDKLITNIKYQEKGQLICMYNDSIDAINNNENNEFLSINTNVAFASIELANAIVYVEEKKEMFKCNSIIHIDSNMQNGQKNVYNLEEAVKDIKARDNVIAVNVGTDLYFLDTNGWLIKKYSSKQEITTISFSNNLAAIIYKDRIEIVNL